MPRGIKKENLPSKNCATCGAPFVWRKKWEKNWDDMLYCSATCRTHKEGSAKARKREINKGGVQIPEQFIRWNK